MKQNKVLFGMFGKAIVIAVLAFALVLAACSGGGGGDKALIGTWKGDFGLEWTFTKDKFTQKAGGTKSTVPYKVKGNSISTEYQGAEVAIEYTIKGDTLSVNIGGMMELEFERVK